MPNSTTQPSVPACSLPLLGLSLGVGSSLIWASSFVLIKVGLDYAGPLTLAGPRYFLAFLILTPFLRGRLGGLGKDASPRLWICLVLMGLLAYPVSNGLLYWSLLSTSATTAAFLFNFSPIVVLLLGMIGLREFPSLPQLAGFVVVGAGIVAFFSAPLGNESPLGAAAALLSAIAFAGFNIFARYFAKSQRIGTVALTALPLGIGGAALLIVAPFIEGLPRVSWQLVVVVLWLASVNTVAAYLAWNRALIRLRAFELNILFAIIPIETALLAWVLRGEPLAGHEILGMIIAIAGILIVQFAGTVLRRRPAGAATTS